MTRKRSARRHGRRASELVPDLDSTPPVPPEELANDYFGPTAHGRERRARGSSRGTERAIGPLRREIERTLE